MILCPKISFHDQDEQEAGNRYEFHFLVSSPIKFKSSFNVMKKKQTTKERKNRDIFFGFSHNVKSHRSNTNTGKNLITTVRNLTRGVGNAKDVPFLVQEARKSLSVKSMRMRFRVSKNSSPYE